MNDKIQKIRQFIDKQDIDVDGTISKLIKTAAAEVRGSEYISKEESIRKGETLREHIPLKHHGKWEVKKNRESAVALLKEQESTRVQELIPLRHERMSVSPFTFYRGSAIIMADDLAATPDTGLIVQAVGDAHISNFGLFASPERRIVYDVNDFDETLPGPWEWDIKRLAASVEICGRDRGFSKKKRQKAVFQAAKAYRDAMRGFSDMGNLDVWYAHVDIDDLLKSGNKNLSKNERKLIKKHTRKALSKNSASAVEKFAELVDGSYRIKSDPPVIVPIGELYPKAKRDQFMEDFIGKLVTLYRLSLPRERRDLICRYKPVDAARKVVGVGSVGSKAWIVILEGVPGGDPLVLQIKQATESVLERHLEKSRFAEHGLRVVAGQKAIQTAGDILLGWISVPTEHGVDAYYVRQLWDGKGSVDLDKISEEGLVGIASLSAWTLAHAHAKTGDRHAIAAYLGGTDDFEKAMVKFSRAYADQNEADYQTFLKTEK
ncbi:MAG: DUF2252 domain-containing protein [Eubacteriaceae bacterium]|nr:DUF2252 domain-containing protein [Eubacteriaceae bacterium]